MEKLVEVKTFLKKLFCWSCNIEMHLVGSFEDPTEFKYECPKCDYWEYNSIRYPIATYQEIKGVE